MDKPSRWPQGTREEDKPWSTILYRDVVVTGSGPDKAAERYYRRLVRYYIQEARRHRRLARHWDGAWLRAVVSSQELYDAIPWWVWRVVRKLRRIQ